MQCLLYFLTHVVAPPVALLLALVFQLVRLPPAHTCTCMRPRHLVLLLQVSLRVIAQERSKHLVQTFKPNASSSSFQQPMSDMNVASGCPQFCALSVLADPSYVKDDVMCIKAVVDTTKISHP